MEQLLHDFSPGLFFMQAFILLVLILLLKKFAWKPILSAISEREDSIANALESAEKAKEEMQKLHTENETLLQQAREERGLILKEAREAKDKMISDAKITAQTEADRIIESAKQSINNEKMAAMTELKNQVATISLEIAEKIIKQELSDDDKQKTLIGNLIEDVTLN